MRQSGTLRRSFLRPVALYGMATMFERRGEPDSARTCWGHLATLTRVGDDLPRILEGRPALARLTQERRRGYLPRSAASSIPPYIDDSWIQAPRMEALVGIIGFLVFGLVVGALARLIKPGRQNLSLGMTLLLGVAGSVVGGVVASLLGTGTLGELNILGAIVAIIAAVLLIGVAESMSAKGPKV